MIQGENIVSFHIHSSTALSISDFYRSLLNIKGPIINLTRVRLCEVISLVSDKHRPPTSSLFWGLALPGKQVMQGNHTCTHTHTYKHVCTDSGTLTDTCIRTVYTYTTPTYQRLGPRQCFFCSALCQCSQIHIFFSYELSTATAATALDSRIDPDCI